ncbi:MAG: NTP transferase domain-containing protein [Planctomycetota bacterium]
MTDLPLNIGREPKVAALLLCAGASTRMGRAKPCLSFAGGTFLSHLARVFAQAGVDEIRVVAGGVHEAEVRAAAHALDVGAAIRVMRNLAPADGPITSVRAALASPGPTADLYFIHPIDIPGVTLHDVRALLECAAANATASAVAPSIDGRRGHPLLLRGDFAARVLTLPPGATLRDLLKAPDVTVAYAELASPWLCRDVNTKEEYDALLADWPRG